MMSATNRGGKRIPNDLYETPEEVTRDFLMNHFEGEYQRILEPCAGSGKMVKVLRKRYPKAYIHAFEKYPKGKFCHFNGANKSTKGDFLETGKAYQFTLESNFDLIFTNPPYSIATEIIGHAMEQWPKATIVMLLRTGFLETEKRFRWWQGRLPTELHVLAKRPSFTGKGNDATAYAWFVWRSGVAEQKINVVWGRDKD